MALNGVHELSIEATLLVRKCLFRSDLFVRHVSKDESFDRVPGRGVRSGRWVIVSGKLERVSLQPLAG